MRLQLAPHLTKVLNHAEEGASVEAVTRLLVNENDDISTEEATAYIEELVECQILVPEMSIEDDHCIESETRSLDIAVPPGAYSVHAFRPAPAAVLSQKVLTELARGAELLAAVTHPSDRMRGFCEAFVVRYGDQEVPLLEALDEEHGIGFGPPRMTTEGAPLLEGLHFPITQGLSQAWDKRERLLFEKLQECVSENEQVINLDDEELEQLRVPNPLPLPSCFAVAASLAAASDQAIAEGHFRVRLDEVMGVSSVNAFGPLCDVNSELRQKVERLLETEEGFSPEAIFAEVVHPVSRNEGAAWRRPTLRTYEIPVVGSSGAPRERQIPLSDLRLSVFDERIKLSSGKLGREVIPRVTASPDHSDAATVSVYRFLCELAHQGTWGRLKWNWGPLEDAPFLPRLISGRIVLSRARWRISAKRVKSFIQPPEHGQPIAPQRFRSLLRLPRFVELVQGRDRTLLDLDRPSAVDALVAEVASTQEAIVEEMYPGSDELCARGPEGRFAHEMIVPFVQSTPLAQTTRLIMHRRVKQWFPPGSEWLLVKLRSGVATGDDVLTRVISPLVDRHYRLGEIDSSFFIRNHDSGWHLRLLFHDPRERLLETIYPSLRSDLARWFEERQVWDLSLGTYRREIGRYGGAEGVLLAEQIFDADSAAVRAILHGLSAAEGADLRWRLAFYGIDLLLSDLGLDREGKRAVIERVRANFAKWLGVGTQLDQQLNARFAAEQPALESLIADRLDQENSALRDGVEALRARSMRLAPLAAKLRSLIEEKRISRTLADLASSYVHMFCNRLLRPISLPQELVLYDFLQRLYR